LSAAPFEPGVEPKRENAAFAQCVALPDATADEWQASAEPGVPWHRLVRSGSNLGAQICVKMGHLGAMFLVPEPVACSEG
jgi:hypothetical protein